jgi:FlaA1/EpsC-like NDP-sugar epimerase
LDGIVEKSILQNYIILKGAKMKNIINGSIVLITGGTGTFGSAFLKRILQFNPKQVRIFSRDEKKQILLRNELRQYNNIKYIIGDIRDISSVQRAMTGVDYVFHAAAMKQIPACEENPIEALKTNVLGSNNVLESAIDAGVKKIVCISTDKAVNPTSIMGLTKLYMEKLALQKAKN